MKVVILAGGYGSRLEEETKYKPKPLVEICGDPILYHIMQIYIKYGFNDFIICCGYKGYLIKNYFQKLIKKKIYNKFITKKNFFEIFVKNKKLFSVTLVNTGKNTMTGGRIKRIKKFIKDDNFFLTYGDGLANINLKKLLKFHKSHKKIATITSVQPPNRYGVLDINFRKKNKVLSFDEKPKNKNYYINGGFFVLSNKIFNFIKNDKTVFEKKPLINLINKREIHSYFHKNFWQCMDSMRDKKILESCCKKNINPPWLKNEN